MLVCNSGWIQMNHLYILFRIASGLPQRLFCVCAQPMVDGVTCYVISHWQGAHRNWSLFPMNMGNIWLTNEIIQYSMAICLPSLKINPPNHHNTHIPVHRLIDPIIPAYMSRTIRLQLLSGGWLACWDWQSHIRPHDAVQVMCDTFVVW